MPDLEVMRLERVSVEGEVWGCWKRAFGGSGFAEDRRGF